MKAIKLNFYNFGKRFDKEDNCLTKLLRAKYDVCITQNADYCIYAPLGNDHHVFHGIRVFYTGENVIPNFNYCDYATSFAELTLGDRHARYPGTGWISEMLLDLTDELLLNRDFCATVISNGKQTDGVREHLFDVLNRYKPVASGGSYKNTEGGRVPDKYAFQKQYKFVIAGENAASAGYTTEKLPDAFVAHAIPIYHGDPDVAKYYNPKAFINADDFESDDALLEYVKKVDQDDLLYLSILREPVFKDNKIPYALTEQALLDFYAYIFDQPLEKARRCCFIKSYLNMDYSTLKARDIKGMLLGIILRYLKPKNLHLPRSVCKH